MQRLQTFFLKFLSRSFNVFKNFILNVFHISALQDLFNCYTGRTARTSWQPMMRASLRRAGLSRLRCLRAVTCSRTSAGLPPSTRPLTAAPARGTASHVACHRPRSPTATARPPLHPRSTAVAVAPRPSRRCPPNPPPTWTGPTRPRRTA